MSPFARIRRFHAIEHATIAVLFQRRGRQVAVVGRSDFSGFQLYGPFEPDEVASALQEALERLAAGERYLAITNHCGTNILATGSLTATAALLAAGKDRRSGWTRAMSAAILATIAAAPLGRFLQKWVTTDPRVGGISLVEIRHRAAGGGRRRHYRVLLSANE